METNEIEKLRGYLAILKVQQISTETMLLALVAGLLRTRNADEIDRALEEFRQAAAVRTECISESGSATAATIFVEEFGRLLDRLEAHLVQRPESAPLN